MLVLANTKHCLRCVDTHSVNRGTLFGGQFIVMLRTIFVRSCDPDLHATRTDTNALSARTALPKISRILCTLPAHRSLLTNIQGISLGLPERSPLGRSYSAPFNRIRSNLGLHHSYLPYNARCLRSVSHYTYRNLTICQALLKMPFQLIHCSRG